MRKLSYFILSLIFIACAGLFSHVLAAEFFVEIDREYTVEQDGKMTVVETHKVTNKSTNLLISKTNEETFQIPVIGEDTEKLRQSVNTAVISVDGAAQTYSSDFQTKFAELKVAYPRELKRNESITFRLEYINFGLVEKTGALIDIYAPGFVEDFQFVKGMTEVTYNTRFRLAKALPAEKFVIPAASARESSATYDILTFNQNALIGKTIWIQRGKTQYYKFKITQSAPSTDNRNTGYLNEYRLILPRDIDEGEIIQKVHFTNITPEPFQVLTDEEGNLIGYFKIPSHESAEIILEGFASVSAADLDVNSVNSGKVSDLSGTLISRYTQAAQYWEVNAQEIQSLAQELKGTASNIYEIVEKTYEHVVDTIDYSEVKRFGLNERQGALKTLNGGAAVCMEYSDLFLTLTRAEGIPARAVFGYGYDPRLPESEQEAHQWVQVFMPGIDKWVSVDVTWGESGPALIGGDLNHFYTHTAGVSPNEPAMVERISYGSNLELTPPDFNITATEAMGDIGNARTPQQLLEQYPEVIDTSIGNQITEFLNNFKYIFDSSSSKDRGQMLVLCGGGISLIAVLMLVIYLIRASRKPKTKD